jgi:hypothetical protein
MITWNNSHATREQAEGQAKNLGSARRARVHGAALHKALELQKRCRARGEAGRRSRRAQVPGAGRRARLGVETDARGARTRWSRC